MIYLSSNCLKRDLMRDSVEVLAKAGFRDIELSYGGRYYDGWEKDIMDLRGKYDLNYCCHNYFVPVRDEFVINLASLDETIYVRSLAYLKVAVALAAKLGAKRYGFHAGFFADLNCGDLGRSAKVKPLNTRPAALDRFAEGYAEVKRAADANGVELYVENNVCSADNLRSYRGVRPFILLDSRDYLELKERLDFNLLLDVAHLKVSCRALGLDYGSELTRLLALSNYWHVSENNALADQHQVLTAESLILPWLKARPDGSEIITLETRGEIAALAESYRLVEAQLNGKERADVRH